MTADTHLSEALEGHAATVQFINVPEQFMEAMREGIEAAAVHAAVRESIVSGLGVTALPEDVNVCDLEKHLPHRRRQRGAFTTQSVQAFGEYAAALAGNGATVFVDTSSMAARAVLDLGTVDQPGHADHTAKLAPRRTAAFDALMQFAGRQHKQQAVAEFLEDWAPHVALKLFNDSDEITLPKALAAVRRITIESARKVDSEQQQLSANMTAFESVSASSKEPLPTTIYFTTAPYADLQSRTFVMRLSIHTGESAPGLTLRIQNMEKHTEEMGLELAELVRTTINGDMPVLLGEYCKSQ
jgi:uncharacterized protein YfdQ (DUF2303 family)